MKNEEIKTNNRIHFETVVALGNKKFDTLLTINEKHLLFQRKKGIFKKKYKVVKDVLIDDIKVINNKVKIEQSKNRITIYTNEDSFDFTCNNFIESKRTVEEINKITLGQSFLERLSNKGIKYLNITKKAVELVGCVSLAVTSTYNAIKNNKETIKETTKK